ncbi:MAG: thiolase family protein [Gammaproteobacteria bacterium]|nr:thiolase family protein [Gammaproteobacteria bacterium]
MDVAIIGIGIHPFGRTERVSGLEQGVHAAREALADASLQWRDIQCAFGGSTSAGNADTMVNRLGLTGLSFINVANGCATGGSALAAAVAAIRSGEHDIAMAVGFDKHPRGAFEVNPADWGLGQWYGEVGLALTTQFFAMKIQKYMHDHGLTEDALIRVAEKAFRNAEHNPYAWRRRPVSYEEIASSPMVSHPLRKYMFCSPSEGAVALVLCRGDLVRRLGRTPIYVKAVSMRTRHFGSFEVFSPCQALEQAPSPSVTASRAAFEAAGLGPEDIDIAQLQDTESGAEIMHMAENGFCADGEQARMLREGETEIGGRLPVNTDGGCLANGEPIGASGLRQVYENVLQLRGAAGPRQVPGRPRVGYSHVYGAPGVSAVAILQR